MRYVSISGPSACGKDTVLRLVMAQLPNTGLSISCTTRAPKTHADGYTETDGVDYFFMTEEAFRNLRDHNGLLEYTEKSSGSYGTPIWYLDKLKKEGKDTIFLNVDMKGAINLKKLYPTTTSIYIVPPSAEELYRRMVVRGRDEEPVRLKRMADNKKEILIAHHCEYLVLNDVADQAARDILRILTQPEECASLRMENQPALLAEIREMLAAWQPPQSASPAPAGCP